MVVTVVTAVVVALVTALTMVLMGELNSIKAEIHAVRGEIRASEARTREEIRASEARQDKRSDELKAEIKAINDLLLATLLSDPSRDAQRASIAWPTPVQEEAG